MFFYNKTRSESQHGASRPSRRRRCGAPSLLSTVLLSPSARRVATGIARSQATTLYPPQRYFMHFFTVNLRLNHISQAPSLVAFYVGVPPFSGRHTRVLHPTTPFIYSTSQAFRRFCRQLRRTHTPHNRIVLYPSSSFFFLSFSTPNTEKSSRAPLYSENPETTSNNLLLIKKHF